MGVLELGLLDNKIICVTYDPEVVGARDLLLEPFFSKAKLAPIEAAPEVASSKKHVCRAFLMTALSALLTIPVLILAWAPIPQHEVLYGAISLGLATAVQFIIAGPFYTSALQALIFSHMIEMDFLIVLSTSSAYLYSVIAYAYLTKGKPLSTGNFFETSTLLVTLIMVGRAISALARQQAIQSISIESLQAPTAIHLNTKTQLEQTIDARLLQYGDTFKVPPDSSIVTDGMVTTGMTEVDESLVTGEATLISKMPGLPVIAGSINYSGEITVRLTRLPGDNTIQSISAMVDEAKSSKPRIQQIADRFASIFVPIILALSLIVFLIWTAIGRTTRQQDTSTACIQAMTYAISALVISCPCAVGLVVPMVVVIASGVAAKNGLIFKSAETIDIARKARHVVFDKTGTLTQGRLNVTIEQYHVADPCSLASMLLGLTANSKHPVSSAIGKYMQGASVQPSQVENIVSIPGCGVEATWSGRIVCAGNPYWLGVGHLPTINKMIAQGLTIFCVCVDGELAAVYGLKDSLRPEAFETIKQLKRWSIEVSIVSGDNQGAVDSVAEQLEIPGNNVHAGYSPTEKGTFVEDLTLTAKKTKTAVIFVGDGTNDAVALAQASIGVHVNEGTEIAQSAADVVLMRPALTGILKILDLSRAFHRRVIFNFAWAVIYNVFALLLAAGAFPGVRVSPQFAGLGELVSVIPVVVIAMGLRWVRL